MKFEYRGDISRSQGQSDFMDGLMDVMSSGGSGLQWPRLLTHMKQGDGMDVYLYGSCNEVGRNHLESAAWCLKAYAVGGNGVLPWQSIGNEASLNQPNQLGLLVPGKRFGTTAVASLRVKALRHGALKKRIAGVWQTPFENVISTNNLRSWYPNTAPHVMVDPAGRTWLHMIWVDGTKDDYNVLFRRIDLGGGQAGDCNGDGRTNIFDLQIVAMSWNKSQGQQGYDGRADLTGDNAVNLFDLQVLAANWNQP